MKNAIIFLVLFIVFCAGAWAQTNVGIGNNTPLTKLDISGALSIREGSALSTLSTGNNNNVALPVVPSTTDVAGFCRITAPTGGPFTITGIVPNTGANGQIITLINTTGKAMTIANANTSSIAANRIYTQTGANLVDDAGATANSSITMQYSQNAGGTGVAGWVVTATQNFSVSNAQLANAAITVTSGTGISVSGSPVALGGIVTVTNTGVTSVGMTMPGIFTVSGSPVTTTGTLTAALASESGNTVFAAPNGSAGTPTFRALAVADLPASGVTAGTYNIVTVNTEGQVTAASNTSYQTPLTAGNGITISAGTISDNLWTASSTNIYNANSGNVGIGTGAATPATKLDVNGNTLHRGNNTNTPATPASALELFAGRTSTGTLATNQTSADMAFQYGGNNGGYRHFIQTRHNGTITAGGNDIDFYLNNSTTAAGSSAPGTGNIQVLTLESNNSLPRVGIGTNTPGASVEISRGTNATQLTGTSADVVIQARNAATGDARLAFVSNDNTGNSGAGIIDGWANAYGGGTSKAVSISFPTSQGGSSGQVNGNIAFSTNNSTTSTVTEAMRVTSSGNIQIGTPGAGSNPYILPANPQSGSNATYLRLGSSSNQLQDIYTNYLYAEAGVMIGSTGSPGFPIDVETATTGYTVPNPSYAYGQSGHGPNQGVNGATESISIYATQNVLGTSFIGFSDARLKNVIGQSNAAEDLTTLSKIKITDYTMRDLVKNGPAFHKKVIAQELKEVYPIAVKTINVPQIIPNIYCNAESYTVNGNEVIINMPRAISDTNIKIGVICRFYMSDAAGKEKEMKGKISAFSPTQLQVVTEKPINRNDFKDNLFVYGTEINDLLAVDYEAISMLNVSATQEIAKRLKVIEAENERLKNSNALLEEENSTLKSSKADVLYVNQLKAQLDDLKDLMEKNGIRVAK